jgi:uncharacterized LabA/DUF88 family protein
MLTHVYIDGANLDRSSRDLGYTIDYKKFCVWLKQKYSAENIYYFIGYVKKYDYLYRNLRRAGFKPIFKEALKNSQGEIKGNCDAELVVQSVMDFYENRTSRFILVTGDGDFRCLVDFLISKKVTTLILIPNRKKFSTLLRQSKGSLTFLEDHYHKFNIKSPDADSSA